MKHLMLQQYTDKFGAVSDDASASISYPLLCKLCDCLELNLVYFDNVVWCMQVHCSVCSYVCLFVTLVISVYNSITADI